MSERVVRSVKSLQISKAFGFPLFFALSLAVMANGCRTATQVQPPVGPPTSLPSAGIIGIQAGVVNGNSGNFFVDFFVVDSNGHAISNLPSNSITIVGPMDTTFAQLACGNLTSSLFGPYSAELLLDQTGSIRQTDPLNLRLIAAKLFLDATKLLPSADEVQLSTFQDSLHDGTYLHSYGPFTHNTSAFEDTVETLALKVGGGTPLYDAMYNETDSLALMGHNTNRALVVFTDGEDNESYMYYPGASLWDAITHAVNSNVKIFAIALKTGLDTALISAAMNTGGSVMHTNDSRQMVSYFAGLSNVIRGGVQYYHSQWHVSLPNSYTLHGQTVSSSLKIKLPDNSTVEAPFSVTFK